MLKVNLQNRFAYKYAENSKQKIGGRLIKEFYLYVYWVIICHNSSTHESTEI